MVSDFSISQSENEIFFYRRMQAQFEVLGILGIEDFNFPKKTDQNKLIIHLRSLIILSRLGGGKK